MTEKAFILLSGGQDSFACLLWALKNFKEVETISIDYGQRHAVEINYANQIAKAYAIPHTLYHLGDFLKSIAPSSLFSDSKDKNVHNGKHKEASDLPASFVPNRNGLFLSVCANHAYLKSKDRLEIVTGTCETDYSGYPDCRDNYIKAKALELSLGLDRTVNIHTPLMWMSKADTFQLAEEEGALKTMVEMTMTCYNAVETLHVWGRGCGECPSCELRKKGFEAFKARK